MELDSSYPIVCVCGPTAVGKSSFAIELAKSLSAEIINADSVQVFKGFDIGSGKVTESEMQDVSHHLLSHVELHEHYSAGRFRKEAFAAIKKISEKGTLPIVVGGTGLYIRALLSPFMGDMEQVYSISLESARQEIEFLKRTYPSDEYVKIISDYIRLIDPEAYSRNGSSDAFRNERALLLSLALGAPSKLYRQIFNEDKFNIPAVIIILEEDRDILYAQINKRVERMFKEGWIKEVEILMNQSNACSALNAIGYRHILNELKSKSLESLDKISLINNIQRDTRRFAKRQITWWRNQPHTLGWRELSISDFDQPSHVTEKLSTEFDHVVEPVRKNHDSAVALHEQCILQGDRVGLVQKLAMYINDFREKSFSQSAFSKLGDAKIYGDDIKSSVVYVRVKIN